MIKKIAVDTIIDNDINIHIFIDDKFRGLLLSVVEVKELRDELNNVLIKWINK
jgi:hypothetical protein